MEQVKTKSLSDLLSRGGILLFDASGIRENNFKLFVKNNFSTIKDCNHQFMMTSVEFQKLKEPEFSAMKMMMDRGLVNLKEVDNYEIILRTLINEGKKKISIILSDIGQRNNLIKIGKTVDLFINMYSINDAGEVVPFVGEKTSQKKLQPQSNIRGNKKETSQSNYFVLKSEIEKIQITPIRVSGELTTGDILFDSNNKSYQILKKEIINNGAVTYSTSETNIWVKLYHPNMLNTFTEAKIQRMLSKSIYYKGLCWPIDIARDKNGTFRGFFIPKASGEPLHLCVFKRSGIEQYFPHWNKKHICELTFTILNIIKYLHSKNILMGCINPAGIRVVNQKEVYFIDTDNYQVEGFPTLVHNLSFTPPELLDRKVYFATKNNENFAIAELVFMLLMPGKTPYAVGSDQDAAMTIKEMKFPFAYGKSRSKNDMPGMWRFMWSHLSPVLKSSFYNTFQKGEKFSSPTKRIPVEYWINDVQKFKDELDEPYDVESLKIYPQSFKKSSKEIFYKCSYCGIEHPQFYFKQEYFDNYKICNGCLDKKSEVSFTCKICGKTYFYTNRLALFHKEKKKTDSDWKNQRYCWDCKKKTEPCKVCGKETPYFILQSGRCRDCLETAKNRVYKEICCRNCGKWFDFTVADYELYMGKGWSEPSRCPDCRGTKRQNNSDFKRTLNKFGSWF